MVSLVFLLVFCLQFSTRALTHSLTHYSQFNTTPTTLFLSLFEYEKEGSSLVFPPPLTLSVSTS